MQEDWALNNISHSQTTRPKAKLNTHLSASDLQFAMFWAFYLHHDTLFPGAQISFNGLDATMSKPHT